MRKKLMAVRKCIILRMHVALQRDLMHCRLLDTWTRVTVSLFQTGEESEKAIKKGPDLGVLGINKQIGEVSDGRTQIIFK